MVKALELAESVVVVGEVQSKVKKEDGLKFLERFCYLSSWKRTESSY